jgi:endonuclease YncB( thermonuclease family)
MSVTLICLVIAVIDGDTLKARCGSPDAYQQVTIRLSEIDAPERGQPFGQKSKEALSALCFREIAAITRRGKDRYGRPVADVECRGANAGHHQVAEGMAWVFERYVVDKRLYEAQDAAKRGRKGLWCDGLAVPPWEWRTRNRHPQGSPSTKGAPTAVHIAPATSHLAGCGTRRIWL